MRLTTIILPDLLSQETKNGLSALGIKMTKSTKDPFMFYGELPEGWKEETDGKECLIMDQKGRPRVRINHVVGNIHDVEFRYMMTYKPLIENGCMVAVIRKGGKKVHYISYPADPNKDRDHLLIELENQAKTWLNQNYPHWKEITAYWE